MLIPSYFRVGESELFSDPARILVRCQSRQEIALVFAEGFLAGEVGREVAAVVPIEVFRAMLKGKVYPAYGSSETSWGELPTGLAPPDPDEPSAE